MEFFATGRIPGLLSGLFGAGDGVVIVPGLILVAQMKPETVTGTSLGAPLLPVGALGLTVGALLGSHVGLKLPPRDLQRAFAVFLAAVAVHM